jgi:hydrogenase nickel incorporation protein HypA/HybF
MHELSVATSIVETLLSELEGEPGRIRSVRVEVGVLSGVVPGALRFAWDVACAGTRLEGAALEIREIPLTVRCDRCRADRPLPGIDRLRCPVCDEPTPLIRAGRELNIVDVLVSTGGPDLPGQA